METPSGVSLADQSREQLAARLTNYEEAFSIAIRDLQEDPAAESTVEMLMHLHKSSGEEHLMAIQAFEQAMTAVMTFKDRVIAELAGPTCPQCGATEGQHVPSCLVGTALRIQPAQLPPVQDRADINLVGLHLRLRTLLRQEGVGDLPAQVLQALQEFPPLI